MTKTCTGPCGRTLEATPEHFARAKVGRYGLAAICHPCRRAAQAAYKAANPEKVRAYALAHGRRPESKARAARWRAENREALLAAKRRAYASDREGHLSRKLQREYGITLAQFRTLSAAQGGACAVCSDVPRARLVIDHDHDTGVIRGLLCSPCNVALGMLRDDPQRIVALARYLERGCVRMVRREA